MDIVVRFSYFICVVGLVSRRRVTCGIAVTLRIKTSTSFVGFVRSRTHFAFG